MTRNNFITKSVIAAIVITAIIFVLVAGGFAMSRVMGSGNHADCLATIPGQPKCVGVLGSIQFVLTHINALIGISLGVVSSFTFIIFALLILIAWLAATPIAKFLSATQTYPVIAVGKIAGSICKQRHWISLLEKRDPYLCRAMNA